MMLIALSRTVSLNIQRAMFHVQQALGLNRCLNRENNVVVPPECIPIVSSAQIGSGAMIYGDCVWNILCVCKCK